MCLLLHFSFFFFFNDTATTEIYTLSLHDALPIFQHEHDRISGSAHRPVVRRSDRHDDLRRNRQLRSEEHTSELQSRENLVCRLLLEKKKSKKYNNCEQRCILQHRTETLYVSCASG